jgi:hypothetical protein
VGPLGFQKGLSSMDVVKAKQKPSSLVEQLLRRRIIYSKLTDRPITKLTYWQGVGTGDLLFCSSVLKSHVRLQHGELPSLCQHLEGIKYNGTEKETKINE